MVAALHRRWAVATATATTAALVAVAMVAVAAAAAPAAAKDPPAKATPSASPAAATPTAAPAGDNPPVDAYVPVNGGTYLATANGGDSYGGDGGDSYGNGAGADTYGGGGAARGTPCDYATECEAGTTCAAPPGGGGGDARSGSRCRSPAPPCGRCDGPGVTCLAGMKCAAADDDDGAGGLCLPLDASGRHADLCTTIEPLPRGRAAGRTPEREAELRAKYGRPNEYRWAYYWAMWDAYNRTSKD